MFWRSSRKDASAVVKPAQMHRGRVPSVLSGDVHILGNLISDGILDLDGKVDGNVRCCAISIRANGKVRGDVVADTVHIHGAVEGLVKARNVALYSTARVQGVIMHETLTVEDGAFVDGKFKRTDKVFVDENMPSLGYTPTLDSGFVNDNAEPESDEERQLLESLRIIS